MLLSHGASYVPTCRCASRARAAASAIALTVWSWTSLRYGSGTGPQMPSSVAPAWVWVAWTMMSPAPIAGPPASVICPAACSRTLVMP